MKQDNFYCNVLQGHLQKPCGLTSCRYNIKNPFAMNCLVRYSLTDEPTFTEVAQFYGKTVKEVKETYRKAVRKVYDNVIEDELRDEVKIKYLPSETVCIYSDSLVEEPIYLFGKYVISSEYNIYPVKIWEYAIRFGTTVDRMVDIVLRLFNKNTLLDEFLGATQGTARRLRLLREAA